MTKLPIYFAMEVVADACMDLALFFFEARRNSGLTISEAAIRSGLSIDDVDVLETQSGYYDFSKIAKLLDLYQERLPLSPHCFKRLPPRIVKKYFRV